MPLAVVAVGGNSLIRKGQKGTEQEQYENALETCGHVAGMIKRGWDVVVTHGNGPQVGFALLRSELAANIIPSSPLDYCDAFTQGELGYILAQALSARLEEAGIKKEVAAVVTRVLVDANDPAFQKPTKPIGPFYSKEDAIDHKLRDNWAMVEDAGRGYRRVVPSPQPLDILENEAIKTLVGKGFAVIAVGGGGIPVVREGKNLRGAEAVIDKDFASALLASEIKADLLLVSTSIDCVRLNYGKPGEKKLSRMTSGDARRYLAEKQFPAGSMGPKIEAALKFLSHGGKEVVITSPDCIEQALAGKAGTKITP
ncbi:carbamate kinase [Candidatus Micrarchaeota archaeon CG08_land_8_20_14_0_20_59_11]|nr:MAG: carbamate kinase [Candidatus Micrarchaeota archaeon CG08_land_8_20_14_0_20_59_11]